MGFDAFVRDVNKKTKKVINPQEKLRCPNNHPMWKLYHKRIGQETIICCRECDKND